MFPLRIGLGFNGGSQIDEGENKGEATAAAENILSAVLFMIRPIASLALQQRRKRIHHNILSGVVDRAELIRGLQPNTAADSIRGYDGHGRV